MKLILSLILSLFSAVCMADMRISVLVGDTNVELDDSVQLGYGDGDHDGWSHAFYLGYRFESKWVLDVGYGYISNDFLGGLTDSLNLDGYEVLLGYQFTHDKLYFEPRIGYAKWELEQEEGALFQWGNAEKSDLSGSDPLLMLTAGIRFVETFGMSLSYKLQDFGKVEARSVLLGFDFAF